jgi:pimeloyl-ACP methyl ester carboxylesterase
VPTWQSRAADAITPLNCGEIYHQEIRNSQIKVIKDCGHLPEMEKPEEFVHLIREFLR